MNLRRRSSESWESFSFCAAETPWATPMVVGRAVRRRENMDRELGGFGGWGAGKEGDLYMI